MRPTLYSRELKLDRAGHFVALNLGYNFFSEHEGGAYLTGIK